MLHCQEIVIDTKYLHCFSLGHSWFSGIFCIYSQLENSSRSAIVFCNSFIRNLDLKKSKKKVGQDGGFEEYILKKTNISLLFININKIQQPPKTYQTWDNVESFATYILVFKTLDYFP